MLLECNNIKSAQGNRIGLEMGPTNAAKNPGIASDKENHA